MPKKQVSVDLGSARLAEKVWRVQDGHSDEVVTWLELLGGQVMQRDGNPVHQWTIRGSSGVVSALTNPPSDPVTTAVVLGFLIAGPYWPMAFPRLLPVVNKEWKRRRGAQHAAD